MSFDVEKFVALALHLKAGWAAESSEQRFKQLGAVTQIIRELNEAGNKNILVMGDLNTTDFKEHGQNYQRFLTFLEVNHLQDFSKELRCTAYWWGGSEDDIEEGSVLDHVMISNNFLSSFKSSKVKLHSHCAKVSCENVSVESLGVTYTQVSDHCPVVAEALK